MNPAFPHIRWFTAKFGRVEGLRVWWARRRLSRQIDRNDRRWR